MNTHHVDGATPLDPDEAEGLIPGHITTVQELNDWQATNIAEAETRAFARKRNDVLTETFVRTVHQWMFDETWEWAGRYRHTDKNIGVPHYRIPGAVKDTCDDASHWLTNDTFPVDELAVRLHHRLAAVHPFPNGNGRHARLMADIVLYNEDRPRLTWGSVKLRSAGSARAEYLAALKEADNGDFARLIDLARK